MSVSLPDWFWMMYYAFFLLTFGVAIYFVIKMKRPGLAVIVIALTFLIPFVSLIFTIGRNVDMHEFEVLVYDLKQGSIWAIFVTAGYLYLVGWWILFVIKKQIVSRG